MNPIATPFPIHHPLKPDLAVSLEGSSREIHAAVVMEAYQDKVTFNLARLCATSPFETGERVRVKYWDEGVTYLWDASVEAAPGPQVVVLSFMAAPVTLQRRRYYRIPLELPFSFTVVDSARRQMTGEKIEGCCTHDISVGGLGFETNVSLNVGDRLAMRINLSERESVSAVGWVVRCQPVMRDGRSVYTVGVEFLQTEDSDQERLFQFLASRVGRS